MNETKETSAVAVQDVFMGNIPVGKIEVAENARKHFNAEAMKDLTENVRHKGVLVPIIVVGGEKAGTYRLVAGERRLRAAKAVGLAEIPARVVKADEATLAEVQMFENLHRADLGPVEEARAFKRLLDEGKHTVEGLAKRVDKSVKYVTRSVRLLELPKAAVKAIEAGALSPEHGHQILRAPVEKRETFTEYALTPKWGGGSKVLPTIHDLKNEIERRLEKDLASACFPKDKEYAGAMACAVCPFNTGNQDVLFEGAKDGKCTDGGCFAKKTSTFLREFREESGKRLGGVKFAGYANQDHGMPREVGEGVVLSAQEAKSETVKALLKEDPKKFGFAVLKPSRWGAKSPSAVLVCNDKDFVAKKLRKSEEKAEARGMSEEDRAKAHFVATHESKALFLAAAKSLKAVKKANLVDVVLALNGEEHAYEAVGVEADEDAARALRKLSEKDLLRLAWLCTVGHYELDERLGSVGVEVKKVRKEARAFALSEWERIQKEEAAKAETPKEAEPAAK